MIDQQYIIQQKMIKQYQQKMIKNFDFPHIFKPIYEQNSLLSFNNWRTSSRKMFPVGKPLYQNNKMVKQLHVEKNKHFIVRAAKYQQEDTRFTSDGEWSTGYRTLNQEEGSQLIQQTRLQTDRNEHEQNKQRVKNQKGGKWGSANIFKVNVKRYRNNGGGGKQKAIISRNKTLNESDGKVDINEVIFDQQRLITDALSENDNPSNNEHIYGIEMIGKQKQNENNVQQQNQKYQSLEPKFHHQQKTKENLILNRNRSNNRKKKIMITFKIGIKKQKKEKQEMEQGSNYEEKNNFGKRNKGKNNQSLSMKKNKSKYLIMSNKSIKSVQSQSTYNKKINNHSRGVKTMHIIRNQRKNKSLKKLSPKFNINSINQLNQQPIPMVTPNGKQILSQKEQYNKLEKKVQFNQIITQKYGKKLKTKKMNSGYQKSTKIKNFIKKNSKEEVQPSISPSICDINNPKIKKYQGNYDLFSKNDINTHRGLTEQKNIGYMYNELNYFRMKLNGSKGEEKEVESGSVPPPLAIIYRLEHVMMERQKKRLELERVTNQMIDISIKMSKNQILKQSASQNRLVNLRI